MWPLKSPHTQHLNAEFDTYMYPSSTPTRTPQWILCCCSIILTQKRTNIQIYIWHFHRDFQMNNSDLIFRGWHELNIHQWALAISVWCAVCYIEWSTHRQFASLVHLSLTFNVMHVVCMIIKNQEWRWREDMLNKSKKTTFSLLLSLSLCPFINDIYSPLSPSWVLVECLEAP